MIRHRKPLRAKNKKTYIAFVLDKSGSMDCVRDNTISAFNEQMQEIRANSHKTGETLLSLVQFSGSVDETFFNIPIDEIEGELDSSQYQPSGSTAMYDAVGYTINKLQRWDEPGDVGFLVIILSDGMENASRKFTGHQVSSLRKELETTGRWTFQYIGCDANAIKEAVGLGFQTCSYSNTDQGWNKVSGQMRSAFVAYADNRHVGATSVSNFMNTSGEFLEDIAKKFPLKEVDSSLNTKSTDNTI